MGHRVVQHGLSQAADLDIQTTRSRRTHTHVDHFVVDLCAALADEAGQSPELRLPPSAIKATGYAALIDEFALEVFLRNSLGPLEF